MEIIEYNENKYKIEYICQSGYAISKWNGKRYSFGFGAIESYTEAKRIIESGGYEPQMRIFNATFILCVVIIIGFLISII